MTEQQRMEIEVGMRVMVKVASREIPATVVEVGGSWFLVRSDSTGREFRTTRVVDILDSPKADEEEIAQAAADIAEEEAATAELRSREENGENADEGGAEENAEAPQAEKTEADEPKAEAPKDDETKAESPKDEEAKADEPKAEPPMADETKAEEPPKADETNAAEPPKNEPKAEQPKDGKVKAVDEKDELPKDEEPKAEEPKTEVPPEADGTKDGGAAPAEEAVAAPRKNLSLVDAAVEVLRAEKRPMGVKELVKLATERGLWIPTKAKTPEQSLYGGLYLEMKNSAHPRVKRSAEKGRFELIG